MAPRNNDTNPNYKKKNFPVENDSEIDVKNIVPCLMHKKHKVVKLVKSQLQKIHEEGLLNCCQGFNADVYCLEEERGPHPGTSKQTPHSGRYVEGEEVEMGRESVSTGGICLCFYLLAFLLAMFLLVLIAVWVSAGPLSNSSAHTPIPTGSFVRTDTLCSLEKKYLLRWSKPEYFE